MVSLSLVMMSQMNFFSGVTSQNHSLKDMGPYPWRDNNHGELAFSYDVNSFLLFRCDIIEPPLCRDNNHGELVFSNDVTDVFLFKCDVLEPLTERPRSLPMEGR